MPNNAQSLTPQLIGFWIKMVRITAQMSQNALAVASGVTERTVQRVEAGERVSVQSRRSLARGLGYQDPSTFDDPGFAQTVTSLIGEMHAEAIAEQEKRYPDHVKIEVRLVTGAADLASLIEACDATVFQCDESVSPDAKADAAELFDNLRDWGDLWSDLSFSERFEARHNFGERLAKLEGHGLHGYWAVRNCRLTSVTPDGLPTLPFKIAYLTIVPLESDLTYMLVPKQADGQ